MTNCMEKTSGHNGGSSYETYELADPQSLDLFGVLLSGDEPYLQFSVSHRSHREGIIASLSHLHRLIEEIF